MSFRTLGIELLVIVVLIMIGAFSAAYFRPPIPTDPLEQLTRIANDRVGWTAQAIIFPLSFLAIAVTFGFIIARLPGTWPRWLAIAATIAGAAAFLLWVPISVNRLNLAERAAELIQNYDPATPIPAVINLNTFWAYTYCALAGMVLMGMALAIGDVLPRLGWIVAGLAVAAVLIAVLVMKDWPPFMSYVIMLVLAIGLIRTG